MEFSGPEYWSEAVPFSRGSSHEPRSPALRADSLPAEPPGKPKNTRVGSISLLQWIFLTEELNRGLLHCKQILYQLSYQGWGVDFDYCDAELFALQRNQDHVVISEIAPKYCILDSC